MVIGTVTKAVLLDNTVLSNLALVGRADLVFRLWSGRVCTTVSVWGEYQRAVQNGLLSARVWRDLPVLNLTDQEMTFAEKFSSRLGAGERSCLAMAHFRGGLVATDDADARAAALRLSIPITGTLGILTLAVRRKLLSLSEANGLLLQMIIAGYRAPVDSLDALV